MVNYDIDVQDCLIGCGFGCCLRCWVYVGWFCLLGFVIGFDVRWWCGC